VRDALSALCKRAFAHGNNPAFYILWGQTAIAPDNCYNGNVNVGYMSLGDSIEIDAEQQHQYRKDDKCIWSPKREPNNPHAAYPHYLHKMQILSLDADCDRRVGSFVFGGSECRPRLPATRVFTSGSSLKSAVLLTSI
jgi:hypothetical protein